MLVIKTFSKTKPFLVLYFINSRVSGPFKKVSRLVNMFRNSNVEQSGLVSGQKPRSTLNPKLYLKILLSLKIIWYF